jgi:hypothetical protein
MYYTAGRVWFESALKHEHLRQQQLAQQGRQQGRLPGAYRPDDHQQLSRRNLRKEYVYL